MQLFYLCWTLVIKEKSDEEVDGVFYEILKGTSGNSYMLLLITLQTI